MSPGQVDLFCRMAVCDQRHCLDVLHTCQEAGHQDRALLQAALLHDAGKAGARLTIWHRVAVVLMQRYTPGWLARWAADGRGWKAPLAAHVRHPEEGARRAAEVGCTAETVTLIRRHHDPGPVDGQLAVLQWADKQN
jgi:hypothetical protein